MNVADLVEELRLGGVEGDGPLQLLEGQDVVAQGLVAEGLGE